MKTNFLILVLEGLINKRFNGLIVKLILIELKNNKYSIQKYTIFKRATYNKPFFSVFFYFDLLFLPELFYVLKSFLFLVF